MLIDWFTIGAQALNFLILVWLLKRFLYQPILNAIDTREKLIAKELADADAKKTEAQKERDEFQKKNEEFDRQRAALLARAMDEAKTERQRLFEEARKAADALGARRHESLVNDARNLNQAVSRLTQKEVFAITRKALADLATTSLEERMGEVFTRRLRELDEKSKSALGDALKKCSTPALIRSTFDIPAAQRAAIQNAVNETFSADIHLQFETSPDLVSGIELAANGQKVGWSIAEYLATLEREVGKLMKDKEKPELKPESKVGPTTESPKPEDKSAPQSATAPVPETDVKPESKPKTGSGTKSEVNSATKPEVKPPDEPVAKAEKKAGAESGAAAKAPVTLTPQTFKRVHELYEELGRADVQAVEAWEKAEREASEGKVAATPGTPPEVGGAPKPEVKPETESAVKVKSEPAIKSP
jgi:F-type H+-transporting ATPase subunit b